VSQTSWSEREKIIASEVAARWHSYAQWRVGKTPPRNLEDKFERTQELCHATLEFIGEVAELTELAAIGPGLLITNEDSRNNLVDEIGDVFFTGVWAMDAWGINPLATTKQHTGVELISYNQKRLIDPISSELISGLVSPDTEARARAMFNQNALSMSYKAGLTANALKKHIYQSRPQKVLDQVNRIAEAMVAAANILALTGTSVSDCLVRNIIKINRRFPNGWEPGGGNRT
jgi:hypothetical protein